MLAMDSIALPGAELGKRKRSPSSSSANVMIGAPLPKVSRPSVSNSLSINYLARQSPEDLPLLNKDDTLPNLGNLLAAYSAVLDRHESLASNLGARPLGPILIKRFERCFDGPPKIVASHHKTSTAPQEESLHSITWLEVIEFARSHPTQFTLSTFSEGRRVCQFYYPQKQLRVQISEEDFLFINSGRCQELIPPLPIWEDEEKEVGACDVLDLKLRELTNVADMVAARTRQLSHRLKGRRAAILERRAEGGSGTPAKAGIQQTTTAPPLSSAGGGFQATHAPDSQSRSVDDPNVDHGHGTFTAVRSELLRHFESLPHNQNLPWPQSRHASLGGFPDVSVTTRSYDPLNVDGMAHVPKSRASSLSPMPPVADGTTVHNSEHARNTPGAGLVAVNHRPTSSTGGILGQAPTKHNFSRPLNPALESTQPFRPLCQAHMDSLPRGHRVLPPCDRCRRLRMDCVKNLTSCAGCTKKHARCHWREVSRDEVSTLDHFLDATLQEESEESTLAQEYRNGRPDESSDEDSNPLEDLEAVGEIGRHEPNDVSLSRNGSKQDWSRRDGDGRANVPSSAANDLRNQTTQSNGHGPEPGSRKHASTSNSNEATAISPSSHGRGVREHVPTQPIVAPASATGRPGQGGLQGGFRAVNDLVNVGTAASGWRASEP